MWKPQTVVVRSIDLALVRRSYRKYNIVIDRTQREKERYERNWEALVGDVDPTHRSNWRSETMMGHFRAMDRTTCSVYVFFCLALSLTTIRAVVRIAFVRSLCAHFRSIWSSRFNRPKQKKNTIILPFGKIVRDSCRFTGKWHPVVSW